MKFDIHNIKNFDKILMGLESISKGSAIVKSALSKGGTQVKKDVQSEIPVSKSGTQGKLGHTSGTLRRSMRFALRNKMGDRNFFGAAVYANQGGGDLNQDGWYVHIVHGGHGKVKPNNFMERGRDKAKTKFFTTVEEQFVKKLMIEAQGETDKL